MNAQLTTAPNLLQKCRQALSEVDRAIQDCDREEAVKWARQLDLLTADLRVEVIDMPFPTFFADAADLIRSDDRERAGSMRKEMA